VQLAVVQQARRVEALQLHAPLRPPEHLLKLLTYCWVLLLQVDQPACELCTCPTHAIGMVQPTAAEARDGAGRVEAYRCSVCQQVRLASSSHADACSSVCSRHRGCRLLHSNTAGTQQVQRWQPTWAKQ
jgi:hypothetical protein